MHLAFHGKRSVFLPALDCCFFVALVVCLEDFFCVVSELDNGFLAILVLLPGGAETSLTAFLEAFGILTPAPVVSKPSAASASNKSRGKSPSAFLRRSSLPL